MSTASCVTPSFSSRTTTVDGDICEITERDLDLVTVMQNIKDEGAGALVFFAGTTRNTFEGKQVIRLEYEAHTTLALHTMSKIMLNLRAHNADLIRLACHHRIGNVPVGECSIIIAVSAPHRKIAFLACETLLEEIKANAQIWKREYYAGGEACWKENGQVSQ